MKKIMAMLLSLAMVLVTMAVPVFAAPQTWSGEEGTTVRVGENYYKTLNEALTAVYMSSPSNVVEIECKENADVGALTHAVVADSIHIIGNNARVTGGEHDLGIDTFKFDRTTGKQSPTGDYLTGDITVTVDNLDGVAAWGQRNTDYTINLIFNDCDDMNRVYFSGGIGKNNITLNDCDFSVPTANNCTVYSNVSGTIALNRCTFAGINEPVNINTKAENAEVEINVNGCTFTDCGQGTAGDKTWAAPIRVVKAVESAAVTLNVDADTAFVYSAGVSSANGDVLVGDGRSGKPSYPVTANVSAVNAEVQYQEPGHYDGEGNLAVVRIGNQGFATLEEAIAASKANDVIDLGGNSVTWTLTKSVALKDSVTIQNGTIELVDNNTADGYMLFTYNNTFKDLTINAENYEAFALFYLSGGTTTFRNTKVFVRVQDRGADNTFYADGANVSLAVKEGSVVQIDGADRAVVNATTTVSDSEFRVTNAQIGFNSANLQANNSAISISNVAYHGYTNGVLQLDSTKVEADNCAHYALNLKGDSSAANNSQIVVTNSGAQKEGVDVVLTGAFNVDTTSSIQAETIKNIENITGGGTVISRANTIAVQFRKVSEEDNTLWDIVLVGKDSEPINRLSSADLTFKSESRSVSWTILPYENVNLVQSGQAGEENRYLFYFGKNDQADASGNQLVIGQVKLEGYGTVGFGVDAAAKNVVHAAQISDNIVDTFIPGGQAEGLGELLLGTDLDPNDTLFGEISTEILVPVQTLTVNVAFPNGVTDNAAAYQDMKATVSGGDLTENIVLNFGSDGVAQKDGGYSFTQELTQNVSYTVTLEGAGYRTVRYTVNMNGDKTLNFWNNVKDEATVVEVGKDASAVKTTFLAGDIVKDNIINLYDLSAVVSYFGTENLVTDHPAYAKYDLNRDGKIDSKDVAMVLVSWGN